MSGSVAASLRAVRDRKSKAFVPYVTAGVPGVKASFLRRLAETGADAIEVGLPFSDPVMDGPVIQEASSRALAAGTTTAQVLGLVQEADLPVPVVVMTYLNPILAHGESQFVRRAAAAGVGGAIVPDLPVDEAERWIEACREVGVATVFLAAPNSSAARLAAVAAASDGFVYCVSTYGVTGPRASLASTAEGVVGRLRPITDRPLVVGVGISTPDQVAEACRFADGVVVGSALMEPILRGEPEEALRRARACRAAARP